MSRSRTDSANILQKEIRRQFGSVGTSRFVRALPGFGVEHKIPERFANLLAELDRAEADQQNVGHSSDGTASG